MRTISIKVRVRGDRIVLFSDLECSVLSQNLPQLYNSSEPVMKERRFQ